VVKQEKYMLFEGRRHCIPSQYCAPLVERLPADRNTGAVPLFFSFTNRVVSLTRLFSSFDLNRLASSNLLLTSKVSDRLYIGQLFTNRVVATILYHLIRMEKLSLVNHQPSGSNPRRLSVCHDVLLTDIFF
jgi:hypothetical protein